jgi:hypothetical protein
VVAGRAKRLHRTNADLDKSRRLIAELSPGTIVLMKNEDKANDEAPWSPPMVVVSRHGNSYKLRWGGSGTLLERLVPVHRLKIAPRGTSVDGVYEVEAIIEHRPAEVGPEALNIEYLVKWTGFDRADSTGSLATRSSKAPSTLLATIGRRDHQRNRQTRHARAASTSKTVASRS